MTETERNAIAKSVVLTPKPYPSVVVFTTNIQAVARNCLQEIKKNRFRVENILNNIKNDESLREDAVHKRITVAINMNKMVAEDYKRIDKIMNEFQELNNVVSKDITTRIISLK
ncbi:hypothetical protein L596_022207 [Steinernema carpocapsae]|uniref:Uncharacterized protein n=1 Tax=Steinernema carpocapsae TaxID=34508 RepID=A0A4U5ML07_STECR|nr:hypothetical protein L596_022207 [Steinernema carpocapsae]